MRTNQAKERRRTPAAAPAQPKADAKKRGRPAPEAKVRPVRSASGGPLPPDPAPPVPAELHFGILLRRARERQGLTQQDVVRCTRIAERWIPALEEARLDLLPAPVFVAGYVRSYARLVGLDEADLVDRYHTLTQQRAQQAQLAALAEAPPPKPGLPWRTLVLAGCSVGLLLLLFLLLR